MQDFMAMILGGPNNYKGRNMTVAHKHMPIERKHYEGVMGHIEKAMKKYEVDGEVMREVIEVMDGFRGEIITKKW